MEIGEKAPAFEDLPGANGERYSMASFDSRRLVVLIFSCNGCPTVKANESRMIAIQNAYEDKGVQVVAINANNAYLSPPDTMAEMVRRSAEKGFNFPYLKDADGGVGRAFGATNTPHVFVLDDGRRLRYTGRIDDSRDPARATCSDLENALDDLLADRPVRVPETVPFGCAITR